MFYNTTVQIFIPPPWLYPKMPNNDYSFSFTAGGLLYHETITTAEVFQDSGNWEAAYELIRSQNLLQSRTASTTDRKLCEISSRLKCLTSQQMALLNSGTRFEQNMLLWLACCKKYNILKEFAQEVLHDKFIRLDFKFKISDIERFLSSKAVLLQEIDDLKDSTRNKVVTVMMRMLREAELVSSDDLIQPPFFTPELSAAIAEDSRQYFSVFPSPRRTSGNNSHDQGNANLALPPAFGPPLSVDFQ